MKNIFLLHMFFMFFLKNHVMGNYEKIFYDFQIESITGEIIDFKDYKNKAILVVNTASFCGFTKQYSDLTIIMEQIQIKKFYCSWDSIKFI